jgi:hypothetical protein
MEHITILRITTVALVAAIVTSARAESQEPTRDQLVQQLEELQRRVAQLEANLQAAQALPSTVDVDQTLERVLRDAEQRSKLLAENGALTAGFDQGRFFIRSDDGNWLLVPGLVFQARYVANYNGETEDTQTGFEVRRMRLIFEGNALTPDLIYKFQWESNNTNGNVFLQDAWVRYKFADQWRVEAGQFKDGIHHEEAMPDQFQLTADRSFINALIGGGNIDRIQGVMLMYDDAEHWRVNLVAHDGYNTKNTNYTDSGGGSAFVAVVDPDYGVSARVEYQAKGTAKQYDDFTALGNKQELLVFGAGANWSQGGDSSVLFHTADAQWENTSGLGVYGALLGMCREIGEDSPIPEGSYYDWGGLVQAGYLIGARFEVFGRYEYISVDDDALTVTDEDTLHEITAGANYFFSGHKLRMTIDLSWLPNGSPIALPLLGILAGDEDQLVLRVQAQLVL